MRYRLAGLIVGLAFVLAAQEKSELRFEMTTYHLGLLRKGPSWSAEVTDETKRIQATHLAHIGKMAESGKLILAGPITDGGELRGIFVFKTDSIEEAKALSEADPAVKAGRLVVELHPWLGPKGLRYDPPK